MKKLRMDMGLVQVLIMVSVSLYSILVSAKQPRLGNWLIKMDDTTKGGLTPFEKLLP